jgi:hypothetical protein
VTRHDLPQLLGAELLQGSTLPVAVVALGDVVFDEEFRGVRLATENQGGCLATPFEGTRDDADERHGRKTICRRRGLFATAVIEADAYRAPGEDAVDIRLCAAVPHENDCAHLIRLDMCPGQMRPGLR